MLSPKPPLSLAVSAALPSTPFPGLNPPPPPALSHGYTVETFNTRIVGTSTGQMMPFNFFGSKTSDIKYENNPTDFTLAGVGGNGYAGTVASAMYDAAKPHLIRGVLFGGGYYSEVDGFWTGTQTGDLLDIMWFLSGLDMSNSATAQKMQGYHNVEVDTWEGARNLSNTTTGFSMHDWCWNKGAKVDVNPTALGGSNSDLVLPAGSYNKMGTFGYLQVPATKTTVGYAQCYYNNQPIGKKNTWNLYSPSQPFPPTGLNIANIVDTQKQLLIIGTSNPKTPLTIAGVRVWQRGDSDNIRQ